MRLHAARNQAHHNQPSTGRSPMRVVASRPLDLEAMTHEPVLAPELTSLLAPEPGQTAVDCTFGGGGHARAIAAQLGSTGTLIAIDRDPAAAARFAEFAVEVPCRTRFLNVDFAAGLRALSGEGLRPEMIYVDLGMSSMQIDAWERGFSYAGGIAREIARRRPLSTTAELVAAIKAGMPAAARFGAGHPAKRSFQAIRIAVNGELDSLDEALPLAWEMLPVGGRFGAIAFHSLEDRPVKQFLAGKARGCVCPPELPVCVCGHEPEAELLTRRAVAPGPAEVEANPRSRSAHLRVALKLEEAQAGETG
jgi:16S rRNA (cytosine1402-N4)-methyltransferase